ncbi:hypothetical protein LPTSP4_28430 [Leptospira ryugenii]|uniref:Uncharacterized protein n=1 Tax=Leptospira ryugenii TaxID=1917863 RepID=A0A2P2E369_9LEPT|nr:hypothetical protein [Leptospira ryugenii]GBF51311.1 hypothetical protein LPTSP4_28430 [Leptospira ryugenii]
MIPKEFLQINKKLSDLDGKNKDGEIYVDNLHSPYIQFTETFTVPSSSLNRPEMSAVHQFIEILSHYIPEAIEGTSLLPEPRPKKETGKLFFARPIMFANKQFIYIFSTDMQYLGGALPNEIKKPAQQNQAPSFETDRIYFNAKIFPVESILINSDYVEDFNSHRFRGGVFRMEADRSADSKPQRFAEIFDELDFSDLEAKIRVELGITSEIWPMGRVFSPVGIDYLALSLRFLKPSLSKIIREFRSYYSILDPGQEGVDEKVVNAFHKYLFAHETTRLSSRSGNVRWKIHFTDFVSLTE